MGEARLLQAGRKPKAKPFTIVIPPPNVTGSLHMGHALNNTIQDILVRFERMRGRDVLWQPGTDHAGIATQMVVERLLQKENKTDRRTHGPRGLPQARVGSGRRNRAASSRSSCAASAPPATGAASASPWTRACRSAVLKVFVQLYKEGLIYKDKRLVNWDPKLLTAISDLEVRAEGGEGPALVFRLSARGIGRVHHRRHNAARDHAGRHAASRFIPTMSATSI